MFSKPRYKVIDHPSDMGIEVEGETLEELFGNAARGMLELISEKKHNGDRIIKNLNLKEDTIEELLHSFLSEILWLIEKESFFPVEYRIKQIDGNQIKAELSGVKLEKEEIDREVKAVTYHQLKIEDVNARLFTRIIFDV